MSAREQILARLNQANVTPHTTLPDVVGWYGTRQRGEDLPQRTARLRAALAAMRAEVHDVTHANWAEVLLTLATTKGLRQVLVGTHTPHGAELLACQPDGIEVLAYTQPIDTWRDLLFDGIDASLTLALGAEAEPGSLVLWPSPSEPRLMSLVPSVHFVLLDADTIHADIHSVMTAEEVLLIFIKLV